MKSTPQLERELVALHRRIGDLERLNDRKVHLFMALRSAKPKVTQSRIGQLVGMSDVGVHNAISRHKTRHAKAVRALAIARDDAERTEAESLICLICAGEEADAAEEPVAAEA